jgi:hypothetical protein
MMFGGHIEAMTTTPTFAKPTMSCTYSHDVEALESALDCHALPVGDHATSNVLGYKLHSVYGEDRLAADVNVVGMSEVRQQGLEVAAVGGQMKNSKPQSASRVSYVRDRTNNFLKEFCTHLQSSSPAV